MPLLFDLQKYCFLTKINMKTPANQQSLTDFGSLGTVNSVSSVSECRVSLLNPADHKVRYEKNCIENEPEKKIGYYQDLSHRHKY